MAGRHFVAALGGLAMVYLAATAMLAMVTVTPVPFGWRPHVVVSGSMQPNLAPGDVILVAPAGPGRFYREGAVITFRTTGGTVTHRIADTSMDDDGASYATKGDANRVLDSGRVEHSEVLGAVRLTVPLVGRPVLWVRQHRWPAVGLWLASMLVALCVPDFERRLDRPRPGRAREAEEADG